MRESVHLVITALVVLGLVAACAPTAPTAVPTKPSAPAAATAAPAAPTVGPAAPPQPAGAPPATATAKPAATAAPAAKIKRGGTVRVHRITDWEHMDPHLTQISRPDALLVYDTLLDLQKDEKTAKSGTVAMLAASWDTSNPKSIVFKL